MLATMPAITKNWNHVLRINLAVLSKKLFSLSDPIACPTELLKCRIYSISCSVQLSSLTNNKTACGPFCVEKHGTHKNWLGRGLSPLAGTKASLLKEKGWVSGEPSCNFCRIIFWASVVVADVCSTTAISEIASILKLFGFVQDPKKAYINGAILLSSLVTVYLISTKDWASRNFFSNEKILDNRFNWSSLKIQRDHSFLEVGQDWCQWWCLWVV